MKRRVAAPERRRPQYGDDFTVDVALEAVRAGVEAARPRVRRPIELAVRFARVPHDHVLARNGDHEAAVLADEATRRAQPAHVEEVVDEELPRARREER